MRLFACAWLCGVLLALAACRESDGAGKGDPGSTSPPAPAATEGLIVLPPDSPQLRQIRVESVKTAAMPLEEVVSPGKIEVNPNRVSRVVLPVPGRIARVMVRLGDSVTQGQPLLAIASPDADTAHAAYLQAEAAVTQARSSLVKTQADFDRSTDLFEHNAVAKKEVLSAENALAQAKAGVEQAQALREQALRRLTLLGLQPGEFGQPCWSAPPCPARFSRSTWRPANTATTPTRRS
jgi:cobalt-zinc-cadmium efflux system membrane fusion protein